MPASVSVSREIPLDAKLLYSVVADYRVHHPQIVPKPEFEAVVVESGGVGAGTVVRVDARLGGRARSFRMRVEEPEPGRELREVDVATGDTTTFTVEPVGPGSRVTIATEWTRKPGLSGLLERLFAPRVARGLYARELLQLERYASTLR